MNWLLIGVISLQGMSWICMIFSGMFINDDPSDSKHRGMACFMLIAGIALNIVAGANLIDLIQSSQ